MPVLDPDDIAPGPASSGRMRWMIARGRPVAARSPTCSRRSRHREIAGQLTGFSGILQVDGYAAYKALPRGHGGAIRLAFCLAHARRKFVEVYKTTQSPFAHEVIERLQRSTHRGRDPRLPRRAAACGRPSRPHRSWRR